MIKLLFNQTNNKDFIMLKKIIKSCFIGIITLSFSACATHNDKIEQLEQSNYDNHIKLVKKRKKREALRKKHKKEENLTQFCFKDAKDIHYRASERCK